MINADLMAIAKRADQLSEQSGSLIAILLRPEGILVLGRRWVGAEKMVCRRVVTWLSITQGIISAYDQIDRAMSKVVAELNYTAERARSFDNRKAKRYNNPHG